MCLKILYNYFSNLIYTLWIEKIALYFINQSLYYFSLSFIYILLCFLHLLTIPIFFSKLSHLQISTLVTAFLISQLLSIHHISVLQRPLPHSSQRFRWCPWRRSSRTFEQGWTGQTRRTRNCQDEESFNRRRSSEWWMVQHSYVRKNLFLKPVTESVT